MNKKFINYFLGIAVPVVLLQLLSNLLQICDTAMISEVGSRAISGVSVANKFFFVFNLAIYGLANGIGLFIAQYFGAQNKAEYNKIFRFGLLACFVTAAAAMVLLFSNPRMTMTLFVKDEGIIQYGLEYIQVIRYSYIPFALALMCSVAFRVKGETKIPLKAGGVAFFLNLLLNYLLIQGNFGFPKMEVVGAALATLISRVMELAILLKELNKQGSDLRLSISYPLLEKAQMKRIIRSAIPLIGNELIWSLALSAIFMNYCYVSEYYIPALTIVDNISSIVYTLFAGAATATGVIIGRALGANKLDQARKDAKKMIKIGTGICIVGSLLVIAIAPFVPQVFSLSGRLAEKTVQLLIIKSCVTWSQGYAETIYYILRSGGDTKGVLTIDGLFTCFGPLLLSLLGARMLHLDIFQVFILTEGSYLLKIFLSTYYYKKGNWLKSLTHNEQQVI